MRLTSLPGAPRRALSLAAPQRKRAVALRPTATSLPGQPNIERSWERRTPAPADPTLRDDAVETGRRAPAGRKWWDYAAPTGAVGRPDISLKPITDVTLPAYGPPGNGGGGGGGGGSGGGGGGRGGSGGGGGWMRGPTYLFAALLLAGGLTAFVKKGSQKSLLFSAAATILLLVAAPLMHHRSGLLLAMSTTLALAGVMGQRANSSGKVMPAGIVAILSALMTCGYAKALA
ncbi:FATTY ACID EXPORT 6 [Micractinium conductrix]|uniref:FATTY ACID EXPORT 6 n=1 Tax=Micractinium conductrix TaxID=554055 RepID=A0A2P6VHL2_9CHLO|nr:FATTY ACID EXPORT 6 [Micractinium conductrix]|eukprot:PSC73575.1 FATTY ACID EXPORT 6 [Micractinium conductrix]